LTIDRIQEIKDVCFTASQNYSKQVIFSIKKCCKKEQHGVSNMKGEVRGE
jgi:hypothetical protein